jgi:hypothetical protein
MVSSTALWLSLSRWTVSILKRLRRSAVGLLAGRRALWTQRDQFSYTLADPTSSSHFCCCREMRKMLYVCALPAGFTLRWRHAHTHSPRMLFTLFCFEFRYGQRTLSSARRETHTCSFPPANICLFVRRLFAWRVQMQTMARHSRRPICGNTALCELSQLCGAWIGKINTEMNGRERNVKSVVFNSRCGWKVLLDSGKLETKRVIVFN